MCKGSLYQSTFVVQYVIEYIEIENNVRSYPIPSNQQCTITSFRDHSFLDCVKHTVCICIPSHIVQSGLIAITSLKVSSSL